MDKPIVFLYDDLYVMPSDILYSSNFFIRLNRIVTDIAKRIVYFAFADLEVSQVH